MGDIKELHKETDELKRVNVGTKVQNKRMSFLVKVIPDLNKDNFRSGDAGEDMSDKIDWIWQHDGQDTPIQFKERPNYKYQDPFMETCLIKPLGEDMFEESYEWSAGRDFEGKSAYTIFGLIRGLAFVSSLKLKEQSVALFKEWLTDGRKLKYFKSNNGSLYFRPSVNEKTVSSWFRRAANSRGNACIVFTGVKMKGSEIWFRIDRSDRRGTYGKLIPYIPLEFLQPYGYLEYQKKEDPELPSTWVVRETKMKELLV